MKMYWRILFVFAVAAVIALSAHIFRRPYLLPLGDSLTSGFKTDLCDCSFGYRGHLQDELGMDQFEFRGDFKDPRTPQIYQTAHSGVGGNQTTQALIRLPKLLSSTMSNAPRGSLILLYIGTNDCQQNIPAEMSVDNVETMITLIETFNPQIAVYVARIVPAKKSVTPLNTLLDQMLARQMAHKKNLYSVDMYSHFVAQTNYLKDWMGDPTHPNDAGFKEMAKLWAAAIEEKSKPKSRPQK